MLSKLLKQKTTYLFFFCIAYIFIYQAILIKLPEAFPFAFELGDIQYKICFAFVTSFIFYVLITFIPREQDKKNVYQYVERKKGNLLFSIDNFFGVFVEKTNSFVSQDIRKLALYSVLFENRKLEKEKLTKQDFKDICQLIHSKDESPINYYSNNTFFPYQWRDYLKIHAETVKSEIADIFILIPHLNTKHISLLTELNESEFIRICSIGKIFDLLDSEPDIEVLHNALYEYYKLLKKIKSEW